MLELATPADRADVNRIARQIHAMHIQWRPDIYEMVEELYDEGRFSEAVRSRGLFVARIDGVTVGYVSIKIRNYDWPGVVKRRVMFLDEIAVEESCRNQGIGSQMMAEIRVLAKAFGCTDLQLGVYPQNDEAVAFYQKNGLMIQSITMQMKL